jgi:phosphoserine aminotransferase
MAEWVERTPWVDFLARDPATRSNTSVCLSVVDPEVAGLAAQAQTDFAKSLAGTLEKEVIAYDIASYRDAPPGLRIWCGATVERENIAALLPWLDWAFAATKAGLRKAA